MEHFLGMKRGEIQVGGSTIPGEYILPELIGLFHKKYPLVSVNLTIGDTDEIELRVLEGKLELGIIGARSTHKSLIRNEWWKDELVIAVPENHRLAGKKWITLDELLKEPFILRESGSGTLKITENYIRKAGTKGMEELNVVARLGTSTAVKEAIKSGLGISILSSKAVDSEMRIGMIKALRVKGLPMSRSFFIIRDKRRTASPLCQAMLDFLLTCAREKKQKK